MPGTSTPPSARPRATGSTKRASPPARVRWPPSNRSPTPSTSAISSTPVQVHHRGSIDDADALAAYQQAIRG
ncbi:hypothetical protein [Amycolatopsis sp. lyj-346]|uniref:hypothetical protein n=1 Tax=Amycolatopsis sp. lyj-346 TaxID=2789289 RepID=UPI00397A0858